MKFLHTMIRVKDIEKSLEFYEGFLDLVVSRTMDLDDCKLYYLSDKQGYTEIELTYNFDTPKDGYKSGENFGHLAFEIDNFEDISQRMKKYSLEYLYEPFMINENTKIAFLKDPDGNEIELIQK